MKTMKKNSQAVRKSNYFSYLCKTKQCYDEKKEVEKEIRKEVGKWFMDIAKYVATATLISTFLGGFNNKWMLYCSGFTLVSSFFFLGVRFLNTKNK